MELIVARSESSEPSSFGDRASSGGGSELSLECGGCGRHLGRRLTHPMCEVEGCLSGVCRACFRGEGAEEWFCEEHRRKGLAPLEPLPVPAQPGPGASLLEVFEWRLLSMREGEVWDMVEASVEADPRPPRRWVPTSQMKEGAVIPRAAAAVFRLALKGCAAAEVVGLFFPRLFLRVGVAPMSAMRAFCLMGDGPVSDNPRRRTQLDEDSAWVRRVRVLVEEGTVKDVEAAKGRGRWSCRRMNCWIPSFRLLSRVLMYGRSGLGVSGRRILPCFLGGT